MQKNYIHNKVKVKVKDREVHLPDYYRLDGGVMAEKEIQRGYH